MKMRESILSNYSRKKGEKITNVVEWWNGGDSDGDGDGDGDDSTNLLVPSKTTQG